MPRCSNDIGVITQGVPVTVVSTGPPHVLGHARVPANSRRRSSRTPGFYTRADVEIDLGLSSTERDTFERAGILGPSERRERGDTRPVLYSATDLALGRIAMAAHGFGIRGEALKRLVDAVRLKQRRLTAGWDGVIVVDPAGDVDLLPRGAGLGEELDSRGDVSALLVLRVHVPPLPENVV